jgi:ribonucleoside-diphosphate reductase alpha subunit
MSLQSNTVVSASGNKIVENNNDMYVTKRNGKIEVVSFDKIQRRIKTIGNEHHLKLNYAALAMKVIDQLYNKISTTKIDELSAEQCASMASIHPDYNLLAGYIIVSNHHKNTPKTFSASMTKLYQYKDKHGLHSPLVSEEFYKVVKKHSATLDSLCDYTRDFLIDYFGFKTLERAYLMKVDKVSVERPQHMWLRVAIGIHGENLEKVKETYDGMSQKYFTHATPTLFNAGTPHPQLSSCYLIAMENDSIEGIYNTLKDCALISKWAGGIGLHVHNVRASGSHIRGTNGISNGLAPMLRVFNNTARYVDQCVLPSTTIYTTEGPKQIQHCVVGETAIFGKWGESEVIRDVLEHHYEGKMVEIDTEYSLFTLSITPEHPVYVLRNYTKEPIPEFLENLEKGRAQVEWVEADRLEEGVDWMVYPIPQYTKDVHAIKEEDCFFYGIVLSHGEMSNGKENTGSIVLNTEIHQKKIEFIREYFEKRVVSYSMSVNEKRGTTHFEWIRNVHLPFRYHDFYNERNEKYVNHRWLNLPSSKLECIFKGMLDTDNAKNSRDLVVESESKVFIETCRYLCLRLGILTTGQIRDTYHELRIPRTKEVSEWIDVSPSSSTVRYIRHQNYLLAEIQGIRQFDYKGILYDLQMTKEHNYLLHNGLVHNGGGKRNGSFAIYLEPWHADIELFLQMRKNHGDEELKARDLFYALWIPDLFMERIKTGGKWTLMCPDECPGLSDVYGDAFVELYSKYEAEGKGRKTMNARDLWFQILDSQMETGTPYILYKDACNQKSNQKNLGTIKSSNLCTEIVEYSDSNETAVCNLASIALPSFIEKGDAEDPRPVFNYEKLHSITRLVTNNLNRVIDVNYYPTEKTRRSNMRHRPIGLGVQGLADVFMMMDIPFCSDAASELNRAIFETIYHAALEESCSIAEKEGTYETFQGSPASKGILQFDMWGVNPAVDGKERYAWGELKQRIQTHGLRNSLLVAPMPTASTSQILGFNECIEPITSNIYSRRTIAGEFIMANKYLMYDLIKLDLWNEKIKNNIIANNGSIQQIEMIPEHLRNKYKTVWEMPMKKLIDMAADRGAFICQSQSLNLWLEDPNYNTLTSMHFYGWQKGLKTGIYYLRRRGRHQAQQFTIEPEKKTIDPANIIEEDEICEMCSA